MMTVSAEHRVRAFVDIPADLATVAQSRPVNLSLAIVTAVRRLTPSYTRVVIQGPDLARFASGGLHFRLLLGPKGAPWPQTDEGGATQWPGGMAAWHRPVYTMRSVTIKDDEQASIDFDVFLQDGGRVTQWVRQVQPTTEIAITGPSGKQVPDDVGWIGLFGDETALPVIARIFSGLAPTTTGHAARRWLQDIGLAKSAYHASAYWTCETGD